MTKSNRTLQCLFLIMMLVCGIGFANAQQLAVSGTVTDHAGEPLIGVTVTVSGTKTGAITDIDGKYSIQADAKGKLKFSYVGYDTLEESVKGRSVIDVVMKENSEMLNEVVVIGYGTMDKKRAYIRNLTRRRERLPFSQFSRPIDDDSG